MHQMLVHCDVINTYIFCRWCWGVLEIDPSSISRGPCPAISKLRLFTREKACQPIRVRCKQCMAVLRCMARQGATRRTMSSTTIPHQHQTLIGCQGKTMADKKGFLWVVHGRAEMHNLLTKVSDQH